MSHDFPFLRQELYRYALYRRYGDFDRDSACVILEIYPVSQVTLKGCWVSSCVGLHSRDEKYKFILGSARKRFAYPTKEEAWKSFQIRTFRRVEILERQLALARAGLKLSKADCHDPSATEPLDELTFEV